MRNTLVLPPPETMSVYRGISRTGLCGFITRASRPVSDHHLPFRVVSLNSPTPSPAIPDYESIKSRVISNGSSWFSHLKRLNDRQNLPSPCVSFQRFVHHGSAKWAENPSTLRPMDYVRGTLEESGSSGFGGYPQNNVEPNADILRITMLRNNTFVTLTDSKGQKKAGVCASAGTLPDKGGKDSRYSAEAAAEHVGREAKKAGVKTVVVKISGFTNFKKKRQAVMAFKEGYTYGRGDQTPIVYIEDKTRLAHNGCRKRKKRRI